jgi:hypothetical protein
LTQDFLPFPLNPKRPSKPNRPNNPHLPELSPVVITSAGLFFAELAIGVIDGSFDAGAPAAVVDLEESPVGDCAFTALLPANNRHSISMLQNFVKLFI